jgi:hypothetical protein
MPLIIDRVDFRSTPSGSNSGYFRVNPNENNEEHRNFTMRTTKTQATASNNENTSNLEPGES